LSLHPNYRVVDVSQVNLTGSTADRVVVSTGPGLDSTNPVSGNTGDVQVLAYDAVAKRWNVVFDAANKLLADAPTSPATALLPQTDRLEVVAAQPVQFAVGAPIELLITSIDSAANHPYNIVGIIRFESGAAHLAFQDIVMNATVQILGPKVGPQTLSISSDYFTPADPSCCPLRKYGKSIGAKGPGGLVGALADDRPWLGAWLAAPLGQDGPPASGVVTAIVDGSPAATALRIGDIVTGIAGTSPSTTATGPSAAGTVAAFRELGLMHANDRATFLIQRNGLPSSIPITLGSRAIAGEANPSPPRAAVIGIAVAAGAQGATPGVQIAQVTPGGPANRSGLKAGLIVTAVGSVPVRTVTDLVAGLTNHAGISVNLAVVDPTSGGTRSIPVTPAAPDANTQTLDSGLI